jgi:hypothetical protein
MNNRYLKVKSFDKSTKVTRSTVKKTQAQTQREAQINKARGIKSTPKPKNTFAQKTAKSLSTKAR